ncbi:MAG: septum formation initiator family protein [Thermodesulfobacteriota bacterium]
MKLQGANLVVTICLILAAMVFIALTIALFSPGQGLSKNQQKIAERDRLVEANLIIAQRISEKYRKIDRLRHDPIYVEFIARKDLGMVRKDELVLAVHPPAANPMTDKAP